MADTIPPALTSNEWKAGQWTRGDRQFAVYPDTAGLWLSGFDESIGLLVEEMPAIMALANAALPDDSPYKITRDDVDAIGGMLGVVDDYGLEDEDAAALRRLAAKLAAMLPPE